MTHSDKFYDATNDEKEIKNEKVCFYSKRRRPSDYNDDDDLKNILIFFKHFFLLRKDARRGAVKTSKHFTHHKIIKCSVNVTMSSANSYRHTSYINSYILSLKEDSPIFQFSSKEFFTTNQFELHLINCLVHVMFDSPQDFFDRILKMRNLKFSVAIRSELLSKDDEG